MIFNPQPIETQTIPPPRSTFGANVLQWVIYDSYAKDFEETEREKEKDKKVSVDSCVCNSIDFHHKNHLLFRFHSMRLV